MMKQIFFAAVLLFVCIAAAVHAKPVVSVHNEQAAAERYRKMFSSGNFYIEFKDKWGVRILAGKNGMRMERMRYTFESGGLIWLNPLGAIFGGGESKNPEVLYKDGKYYHFIAKDKVNICAAKDIDNENINPRSGWNKIPQKLALPDELAVFFWKDPFRLKSSAIAAPTIMNSFKKDVDGKDYDCDRYTCDVKTANNKISAVLVYEMVYDAAGELFRVESHIFRNGRSYPINVLEIKKIQENIPDGVFKIAKNTKVYSAGMGDIDDLLERPKFIGQMEVEL